jgi:hypothetical protein
VSNQDDFFTPQEVDRQIDQVSQRKTGEQADAEAMAYLRSFYGMDARQEREALDRIWNRIADATPPFAAHIQHNVQQREEVLPMQNQPTLLSNRDRNGQGKTFWQRLGVLAAVVFLAALVGSLAFVFYAVRQTPSGPASGGPKPPVVGTTAPAKPTTATSAPFKVIAANVAVTPDSIAGMACGTNLTVTYTATIDVVPNGPGGTVQFTYTVNNGRSQAPASLTFAPGQTSKTYSFTWSGALPADHTYPSQGGIQITSPNQLTSPLVKPSGTCK